MNGWSALGLGQEDAGTATSISMVFLGALLTALSLYDNIAKYAGAGTLVPITGFSNSVASPAIEFKTEGYVYGMAAKMFIVAGPIIVYGVLSATLVGLLYLFL
jgi:stage V sporulation protein AC